MTKRVVFAFVASLLAGCGGSRTGAPEYVPQPHAVSSSPYSYAVVYRFTGGTKGYAPAGGLAIASNGAFLGVTELGGTATVCRATSGCGTVYALKRSSHGRFAETVAYRFLGGKSSDGQFPWGPLLIDPNGTVFGVTSGGGTSRGTVFQLTRTATGKLAERVIYRFHGKGDGAHPTSGLYEDAAHNLFGATITGGDNACGYNLSRQFGCGTVFRLSKSGSNYKEKTIVTFEFSNGASPSAGVVGDGHGHLFGTSPFGPAYTHSSSSPGLGLGLVYEAKLGVIYAFQGKSDGAYPNGRLLIGADGSLYGTAAGGGSPACAYGCGTVFKLTPSSSGYTETTLYQFQGAADGDTPFSTLVGDAVGNLYGTTHSGGDGHCNCGTVFELIASSSGYTERTLHDFTGGTDGSYPREDLIFDQAGVLYGTTEFGGNTACRQGCGTAFSLRP